ncbi:MAG TPA: hypothetical protein DCR93_17390 [Cytophagales bacterium]|nr:hypothetical protein [Cytophagales bacterium]
MVFSDRYKRGSQVFVAFCRSLLVLVFVMSSALSVGQTRYIRNHDPNQLITRFIGAQKGPRMGVSPIFFSGWQGEDGLLYFNNAYGLYIFDGQHWDYIQLPDRGQVTAMAHNESGQVWMGSDSGFGQLLLNESGRETYQEIVDEDLGFPVPQISRVVDAYSPGIDTVFFVTSNQMFFKLGTDAEWRTLGRNTSFGKFRVMGKDSLFVQQRGLGLFYFNGSSLQQYDNTDIFRGDDLKFTLPHPDGGWILSDGLNLYRYQNKVLTQIFSEFSKSLKGGTINTATWLENGYLAIGTASQGVYMLDAAGSTVLSFDRDQGLTDNGVLGLFVDRDEQLWVSTFNGISQIDYTFPFPEVYNNLDANGPVYHINEHQGDIFIGSQSGLYMYMPETNRSTQVPGVAGNIRASISFRDEYFFGGNFGLYRMNDQGQVALITNKSVRDIDTTRTGDVVISGDDGLFTIGKERDNAWRLKDTVGGLADVGFYYLEFQDSLLFASSRSGQIFVITPNIAGQLDLVTVATLDSTSIRSPKIFKDGNALLFGSGDGLYAFNEDRTGLVADGRLGENFAGGNSDVFRLLRTGDSYWFYGDRKLYHATPNDSGFALSDRLFKYLPGGTIYSIFQDSKGRLWLGGVDGVSAYEPTFPLAISHPSQSMVRRVFQGDSLIYFGRTNPRHYSESQEAEAVFLPEQNEFTFYFANPSFRGTERLSFLYKLEGWEQDFVPFEGTDFKVTYKNLSFGRYTFRVYTENQFRQASGYGTYSFVISPPWYWQWWAFTAYGVLLLGFIVSLVLGNTKRLRNAKSKLEALVNIRTEELDRQKSQVEDQKTEIEHKNHKIEDQLRVLEQKNKQIQNYNAELLDSLRYAKRLQDSIFSSDQDLQRYFPESFVYAQPKEIVGGDFCWVTRQDGQVILVLADCTGHGVPGAFMSIVGYNILQQIIIQEKVTSPGAIMARLDRAMRDAVAHSESTAMKDGMDVSICTFDAENKTLRFAGAFHSLFLVRERELREIKGNRYTVGVYFGATEKHFEEHKIAVEPEDIVYLMSDGIQDQFGGPYDNKLMKKGLRAILMEIHEEALDEQRDLLASRVNQWMGGHEQIDDILAMGIKF